MSQLWRHPIQDQHTAGDGPDDENPGLWACVIGTWDNRHGIGHNHVFCWIKIIYQVTMQKVLGKQVQKTTGCSNEEKALRQEFVSEPEHYEAGLVDGDADMERVIVDRVLSR